MQRFKKLLVAITPDRQEQPALRRAVQLAQSNDAELDVIEVMEEMPHHAGLLMKRLRVEATLENIKRETMGRLEALVTPLKATGIKVHTHVATGTPFLEIIRTVLRDHHDLVVKAIEPEREWKQMFLGSTDLHLLRKCPGGLWLVKPAEPTRYRRILVAIDPDMEDPVKRQLAVRLLHMATSLAQSEGAELLIGHAWTPFAEGKFKDHLNTAEFRSYLRSSRQESASRLQMLLSVVGASPSQKVQLTKGKASIVIPRLAKRHAVDLVVMGYRRRTGFLAGLTVAQISEFSLIVAALGLSIGHITQETMGLITLVGVVTIFASTYLILYSGPLYRLLSEPLKVFERRNPYREATFDTLRGTPSVDVILVGLGNYGSGVAEYLVRRHKVIIGVDFDPVALERWVSHGISVLYGDMADPELHEQLPLSRANWVVSTVRSKELNLALVQHLKHRGYDGKVALTATNQEEAHAFEKAGTCVVLRPFADAAEQAADALTYAMDFLPANLTWPIGFREVRIQSDASVAGKKIKDIPLRSETGVSILAVSRAGRVYYDPQPDYQIYPGDRLIIMGSVEELRQAETLLRQFQRSDSADESSDNLVIAEIRIADYSGLVGQTLAEVRFRQRHGVTVAGIRRGEDEMVIPTPAERLLANDSLIVIGNSKAVECLQQHESL